MNTNTNTKAFFELVRAGLWEKEVRLSQFDNIDFSEVYRLAEEQSVIGMVAAGIDHVVDVKVPQAWALQFAGQTIQLEQRNKAMNAYIAGLIDKLRKENVYALLVKGQGVAQCYENPLWRCSGDIDLFLSDVNFQRAKSYLLPLASSVEEEYVREKHLGLTIDGWVVELHGNPDSRYDSNFWLCTITLDENLKIKGQENAYKTIVTGAVGGAAGVIHAATSAHTDCEPNANVEALRVLMDQAQIEARPVWKPMHKQPCYKGVAAYVNGVSEALFKVGMCLPAGPYVSDDDVKYFVETIKNAIVK